MKKNLVIVESPAKARTLEKFLGKNFRLKASLGHIRDLPKSQLGIDIEKEFAPKYVVPRDKNKIVTELKQAVQGASTVYLATDPDREGEAISWHLAEVTKRDHTPYRRVVFHEITKEAIRKAFDHPRSIDMQLVNAQQARRILDRLVGYQISPWLWRKVRRGLSAGRVQSVAVRIIVDREREIEKFVPQEYWTIEAELAKPTDEKKFRAALVGLLDGKKLDVPNQKTASGITKALEKASYQIIKISTKKASRQPAPPFTTSTLQQEAWRKLRSSAQFTMRVAQQLYEGLSIGEEGSVGLITYMRTDSTRIAHSAAAEAREFITDRYGQEYLPARARSFRSGKGAQEAHEAIRPTKVWREPQLVKPYLSSAQFKLYELIWKRMVASQMAAATLSNTTIDIEARCQPPEPAYLLRSSRSQVVFPGFTILYVESKDDAQNNGDKSTPFPHLEKGDPLKLLGLFPEQRFTQPPPRFTEASLIKMLEQEGIGRPSTYAPILSTIQDRNYVDKNKGIFQPTEAAPELSRRLHEDAISFLRARHPDVLVSGDFTKHDYRYVPGNAQVFDQHVYAGWELYHKTLYPQTIFHPDFDPQDPLGLPALREILRPDFVPWHLFLEPARNVREFWRPIMWLYENLDNGRWDRWVAQEFPAVLPRMMRVLETALSADAAEARRRNLPLVFDEGGFWYPPRLSRFELSPAALGFLETICDLAIANAYWGFMPGTYCGPQDLIWNENPDWLRRINTRFLRS